MINRSVHAPGDQRVPDDRKRQHQEDGRGRSRDRADEPVREPEQSARGRQIEQHGHARGILSAQSSGGRFGRRQSSQKRVYWWSGGLQATDDFGGPKAAAPGISDELRRPEGRRSRNLRRSRRPEGRRSRSFSTIPAAEAAAAPGPQNQKRE